MCVLSRPNPNYCAAVSRFHRFTYIYTRICKHTQIKIYVLCACMYMYTQIFCLLGYGATRIFGKKKYIRDVVVTMWRAIYVYAEHLIYMYTQNISYICIRRTSHIYVYAEHLPTWLLRGAAHPSNHAVYDDSSHGTSVYLAYVLTRMRICFEGLHVCLFVVCPPRVSVCFFFVSCV